MTLEELRAASLLYPADAPRALALADALHEARRLPEAIAAYETALRLDTKVADAWYGLGCAHLALKSFAAAAAALTQAASLAPGSGPAHVNLATCLFELGQVEAAIRHFECAARLDAGVAELAERSIACIIPGSPDADHDAVRRARMRWAKSQARQFSKPPLRHRGGRAGERLRIGYISAFFGARNWMKPVFAVINRHGRSAFTVKMFCDGAPPSAASGYADYAFDEVHDLSGVGNAQAASIIAEAGVDVLVDLNGYSAQERLPVLMRRPAPKIVGWFNMFATTGVSAFDFLVGDATVIPRAEERFYTEGIFRVPGTYLAFEVLYDVPGVAPPPCLARDGKITFGSLGSHYKLTDAVIAAWSAILRGAPAAQIFIKNGALDDLSTREHLLARFSAEGVACERITLEGRSEHFAFLDAYRHIDIALDTFPYNGGTTTTEALWQGVPVLSFWGDRWAARTSASLLNAAGMQDWVMPDQGAFVRCAITLGNAGDTPELLAELRAGMRTQLRGSKACDAEGLCRSLEDFFRCIV